MSEPVEHRSLATALADARELVRRERDRCLWFLREEFLPDDAPQTIRVLKLLEKHGDRQTYIEARRLREWLLQNFKDGSAT